MDFQDDLGLLGLSVSGSEWQGIQVLVGTGVNNFDEWVNDMRRRSDQRCCQRW